MLKPKNLKNLFSGRKENNDSHDKLIIEDIKKRLHDQLSNNPTKCKKAAIILENWLQQKPKK